MTKLNLTRPVVCAANRCGDITLVGPRHWDSTMRYQYDLLDSYRPMLPHHEFEQGFINSWGEFLTRKEAWEVACRNDQIMRLVGGQTIEDMSKNGIELYSENLY